MTDDEKDLLLATARAVAEILEAKAEKLGTTDNLAEHIRKLVEKVRP